MSIKYRLDAFRREARSEFLTFVSPLLSTREVQRLDAYVQHLHYTRLTHSLDVAYLSFCIAKILHCDSRSCARGALLHDLHYRGDEERNSLAHMRSHPETALLNARAICVLNPVEEDIIRKHMWLISLSPPRYKESYIVTFVDKICALREVLFGLSRRSQIRHMALNPVAV